MAEATETTLGVPNLAQKAEIVHHPSLELSCEQVEEVYGQSESLLVELCAEDKFKIAEVDESDRPFARKARLAVLAVSQEKQEVEGAYFNRETGKFKYVFEDEISDEEELRTIDILRSLRAVDKLDDIDDQTKEQARNNLNTLLKHLAKREDGEIKPLVVDNVDAIKEDDDILLVGKAVPKPAKEPGPEEEAAKTLRQEFGELDPLARILLERLAHVRPNALPKFYEIATDPEIYKDPRTFLAEYRKLLNPTPRSEAAQIETAVGLYKHFTRKEPPKELARNPDLLLWQIFQDEKVQKSLKEVAALFPNRIIDKAKVNMDWFTNTSSWEKFSGAYKTVKPSTGKLFLFLMLFQYVNQTMEQE